MRAILIFAMCAVVSAQTAKPAGASFLGVMVEEIDGNRAKALKLPEEAGVEVTRIEPDSPAEKSGLKDGDVVVRYNGQRIEGMEQFSRLVRETPPGREVKLDINRNGAAQTITVRMGARPASQTFDMQHIQDQLRQWQTHLPDLPRSFMTWRNATLGIDAEALDGQLAQYFGVKDGVLVRGVEKNSPAEKAGMKAGDVIEKIDENHVASPADLSTLLHARRNGSAAILVMREHREMTLTVKLEDEDRADYLAGRRGVIV